MAEAKSLVRLSVKRRHRVVPRFRETVPIDDYVLDVLMRDLVGHDQQPAAFLVYLFLFGRAVRAHWQPVAASLRMIADETGLSKSAVQTAVAALRRNELIASVQAHATAVPEHTVLRHWRQTPAAVVQRLAKADGRRRTVVGKTKATRN
jgi:hypothetical protein